MSGHMSRRASDIRARKHQFLWCERIAIGEFTVIAGPPEHGKSMLSYTIHRAVNASTIFVTEEEEDDSIWKPKLLAAGCNPDLAFHHGELLFGQGEEGRLAELVERYGAKLVIAELPAHLKSGSMYRDDQMRQTLKPYVRLMRELLFAIIFQVHVLRDVPKNAHPRQAIPAGLANLPRSIFLLGEHPTIGADPSLRVLAPVKFNLGPHPASMLFEIDTTPVKVFDEESNQWQQLEFPFLRPRGEVNVSAKALLVKMRPEDKERKSDRVAHELIQLLRRGPLPRNEIRPAIEALDPPISWKTAERVANEMGIIKEQDKQDARKLIWTLPDYMLDELAEAGHDPVEITEVNLKPPPDTVPEDWSEDGS
jgi:hypothetical protein